MNKKIKADSDTSAGGTKPIVSGSCKKIKKEEKIKIDTCSCGKKYYDILGIGKCYECFKGVSA